MLGIRMQLARWAFVGCYWSYWLLNVLRIPVPPLAYYDREYVNKRILDALDSNDDLKELMKLESERSRSK